MNNHRKSIFISRHALEKATQRFGFKEKGNGLREKIKNEIKNGRKLSIKEIMKRKIKIGSPKYFILFENRIYVLSEDNCVVTAFLDKN